MAYNISFLHRIRLQHIHIIQVGILWAVVRRTMLVVFFIYGHKVNTGFCKKQEKNKIFSITSIGIVGYYFLTLCFLVGCSFLSRLCSRFSVSARLVLESIRMLASRTSFTTSRNPQVSSFVHSSQGS